MGTIIGLIVGFLALCFLYGVIGAIMAKWPWLIWVIGLISGVVGGVVTSIWWVGLIIAFFVIGLLAKAQTLGGHKCAHCGSWDCDVIVDNGEAEVWECQKCGNHTSGLKRK